MDVARQALSSLQSNAGAAGMFGQAGPTPAELESVAKNHPAYVALGAIGPDMFFLLPDFKPPVGSGLFGAADFIRDLYTFWDENFVEPFEDTLGPIVDNTWDQLSDAATGGLLQQLGDLATNAINYLIAKVEILITTQYDVFGILGSGVPEGYDEQTFFWSDMLHYRRTFHFGRTLYDKARASGDDRQLAYALGWMSHLATDVTGHAFTNEKCGGPYRLHWQRHKLVENHMDAKVYDSQHGTDAIYNMLSNSAQHLWIAFNPDGSSRQDCFATQPGPTYPTGDETPDLLARKAAWNVDSEIPGHLADFLAEALQETYNDADAAVADATGHVASHPTILTDYIPGSGGYADAEAITTTYWWLYHYLKWTTTDYYKTRRPSPPAVINIPPFPSAPGSGTPTAGPGDEDDSAWADALSFLLAILAWLAYAAQVIAWALSILPSIIGSLATYPVRATIYEYLEVPLYNAWLAVHWYLAHIGFALPMQSEMNVGLMTLGLAPADAWEQLEDALDDLSGGIATPTPTATEPSGAADQLPREVVLDDPPLVSLLSAVESFVTGSDLTPSEFLRPWLYPENNQAGEPIPIEQQPVLHSPYHQLQDATVLVTPSPGDDQARKDFAGSRHEAETIRLQKDHLSNGRTLGDPVDFTAYVVAKLTRDDPGEIADFNLDSDRGYAYLCWDWLRNAERRAAPSAYRGNADAAGRHEYPAPVSPGYGWDPTDVLAGPPPPEHDSTTGEPTVSIRYIGREEKFS
jgi:hypothetical protein